MTNQEQPDTRPGPERIARMFHEAYERLAPSFAYETREAEAMQVSAARILDLTK